MILMELGISTGNGKLLSVSKGTLDNLRDYQILYGEPVSQVKGVAQFQSMSNPHVLITVVYQDDPQPMSTEADWVTEGVGHAWGHRLSQIDNKQLMTAISAGVEAAMRGGMP